MRGPSGRIIVELKKKLKNDLREVLDEKGMTIKDWVEAEAKKLVKSSKTPPVAVSAISQPSPVAGYTTIAPEQTKIKYVRGVYEWARNKINVMDGCEHGCIYCYACAIKTGQWPRNGLTPANWTQPKRNDKMYFKVMDSKIPITPWPYQGNDIMYPSSHDIHPDNLTTHIEVIDKILSDGCKRLLIVTKAHPECIKEITAVPS